MKSPLLAIFASLLFRILSPDVTRNLADESYDFIVVGAGTSGCVVASRLSDDPTVKVLLLEPGKSDLTEPRISIPINRFRLARTEVDWNYTTSPQENAFASNPTRTFPYVRGKVLGGTSSVNYMGYIRGSPHDYDSWEAHGALGWNYKSVEPNFRNVERAQGEGMPDSLGKNGRLKMTKTNNSKTVTSAILSQMAKNLGHAKGSIEPFIIRCVVVVGKRTENDFVYVGLVTDDSGKTSEIFGISDTMWTMNIDTLRKRLHIVSQAYVTKILIDDDMKAYGVQYSKGGQLFTTSAEKEVILSAGALATPHLLMLSGIGPEEELKKFNIPVRVNLPGVGSNLQDHMVTRNSFTTDVILPEDEQSPTKRFISEGTGPLADNEGFYIVKKSRYFNTSKSLSSEKTPFPELFGVLGGSRSAEGNLTINSIIFFGHPKSTGKVSLRSADPKVLPIVDPKHYSNQDDLDMHVEGHRFLEEFETSEAFIRVGAKYKKPRVCQDLFKPTVPRPKEFYECLIKNLATPMCHASGTAKIGKSTDKWAVVDPELRVYGVKSLRVADASVMPHITSANTQAPCYMIGEKAAEMIKSHWKMI